MNITPIVEGIKVRILPIAILVVSIGIFTSCGGGNDATAMEPATTSLDAAREFIQAKLEGNEKKMNFYTTGSEADKEAVHMYMQSEFNALLDGERKQLKVASITILSVTEPNDSTTQVKYANSVNQQPQVLTVVKRNGIWAVKP
jgi:hypothetical protein